jgi:hypothetical protein
MCKIKILGPSVILGGAVSKHWKQPSSLRPDSQRELTAQSREVLVSQATSLRAHQPTRSKYLWFQRGGERSLEAILQTKRGCKEGHLHIATREWIIVVEAEDGSFEPELAFVYLDRQ